MPKANPISRKPAKASIIHAMCERSIR
jgi:hypothetical protein